MLEQKQKQREGSSTAAERTQRDILEQKKEEIAKHFEEQATATERLIQQQAILTQQKQVEEAKGKEQLK